MMEEQPQPYEAEDDDWVNSLLAKEALEFDNLPPSSPLQPISSSPKSLEKAPSTSKPVDVGVRICVPHMIETYQKEPLAMVEKFLLVQRRTVQPTKHRPLLATLKRVQRGHLIFGLHMNVRPNMNMASLSFMIGNY
jgi:hypothetical protein